MENKLQAELIVPKEILPVVIKSEMDINIDHLTDYSSGREDSNRYLVEKFQNEVNFPLKTHIKSKTATSESEAIKPLDWLWNSDGTIKEEDFAETKFVIPEKVDIKSENEGSNQSDTKVTQNEVRFSLEECSKTNPTITDSEEDESSSTFKNCKCNEETIKDEYFIESKTIVQEELDIKDEDEEKIEEEHPDDSRIIVQQELGITYEGEGDQFTAKSTITQIKKSHNPRSRTAPLNWISTNNRRFQLTEPPVFKCLNCTYQTHRKQNIVRHLLNHKHLQCSHCSYRAKNERAFKKHQLIHSSKGQVKLYQCPECSYTSMWKLNLTRHLEKHKKPDEVSWYQCPECPYKSKSKKILMSQHMVTHKKDVPVHKCALCCYESFRKTHLTQHIQLKHGPNNIQLIHCQEEGCTYKTHHKSNLARHIRLMHECERFFECSRCSYQTKHRSSFKTHELRHENSSKWFSCTLCPHKAASAALLKLHVGVHKSGSEIRWFQCSECPFKSKYNSSLTVHKLSHNLDPQKVLKCSECSYKTFRACNFQDHQLVHRKPEEISKWFCCYLCTLRTPRRWALARHIQKMHRDTDGRIVTG